MYCIKKVILFANFLRFDFKLSPHIWYFCRELDIVFRKLDVELFQLWVKACVQFILELSVLW